MLKCDYLLMEDLVANGYKNVDRTVGLDQRQMEAVLKKMAQWHAASAVRVCQFGEYEDNDSDDHESDDSNDDNFKRCRDPFLDCLPVYNLDPQEEILIAGLEVEFGAKCYKLDIKEDHIVLEDLKAKGFRPTDRLAGLNKEHTLGVLKKLAQWHAASATRVAIKGPYPEHLNKGLFTEEGKALLKGLSEGAIKYILKSYETIEGHEVYYDAVKNMEEHIMKHIWQVGQVDPNEFNVLNHNDCWLSNIMFQYDDQNQLLDTYLVDYQLCKYGNVALDLLYFLVSSPRVEIKIKEFDYFIKFYHDQLIEHLQLLKYPKVLPTLVEIHTQLLKYGVWGFNVTLGVMAGANLEDAAGADFDNLLAETPEGEKFRTQLYAGKQYKEHVKIVLPWLLNRGALHCPNIDNVLQ
ncbi:uncharacterized protein [Drosophila tropicalis]|uniref:uncharacterized protein n=1 Tax=Drosophila tropicalis TaxID=46794 RepID=UPI0035ABFCD7